MDTRKVCGDCCLLEMQLDEHKKTIQGLAYDLKTVLNIIAIYKLTEDLPSEDAVSIQIIAKSLDDLKKSFG